MRLFIFLLALSLGDTLCCYYRNHYHDALCANSSCFISEPMLGGEAPKIFCSTLKDGCLPPMGLQMYWLEGFRFNCEEC